MSSNDSSSSSEDVVLVRRDRRGTEVLGVLVSSPQAVGLPHVSDEPCGDAGVSQPHNEESRRRSEDEGSRGRGKTVATVILDQPSPLRLSHSIRTAAAVVRVSPGESDESPDVPAARSPRMTGSVSRKRSRDETAPVSRMVGESSTQPRVVPSRTRETVVGGVLSWTERLVRENISLKRDMASLKLENELLTSRSGPAELVRLKKYAEERDAKVRELIGLVGQEVDLRSLAEVKFADLKTHLNALEHANSELVDHVRSQMSRLRASRRDYGLACARSAALKTHARLVVLAQTSISRARQYFLEQRAHLSLVSRASQVKTQLDDMDLMAAAGVTILPEDRARVEAKYDGLMKEFERHEVTAFSDREYTFAPGVRLPPSDFEIDCPPSPLGAEEFGIKDTWAVEASSFSES